MEKDVIAIATIKDLTGSVKYYFILFTVSMVYSEVKCLTTEAVYFCSQQIECQNTTTAIKLE